MYKIMIVDDEETELEALRLIIEKNFSGSFLIETAKTGRSAIELAENFRPDIAFMDICMPGINGIEAIKEINKNNNHIIFIIVSAYDKFEYAKEAVTLGVMDYINKPADADIITKLLKKAMKKTDMEREKRSTDLIIKEKLETMIPIIENGLVYSMLFQENYIEETKKIKHLLGIKEDIGYVMVIEYQNTAEGAGINLYSNYVKLRETIKEYFLAVVGPVMANSVIIFVPCGGKAIQNKYEKKIKIIENTKKMLNKLKDNINVQFRAGIGSARRIEEANISYTEAVDSLRYIAGNVTHISDFSIKNRLTNNYPVQMEQKLIKIREAARNVPEARERASASLVEQAKEYISSHYFKNISLDEVSREINISPYYFSKLFKEETGGNFIDYVTAIRMEKAKELLSTTDKSMKEICSEVGYSDPNYFSRSFKKNVGVTPTVYKEEFIK